LLCLFPEPGVHDRETVSGDAGPFGTVLSQRSVTMSATSTAPQVDLKLEVVVLGVSDVDRAKAFYEKLGCRVDADFAIGDDFRVVQVTPHNSEASILFGKGITSPRPGSTNSLIFAVDDVDVARDDLIARGVDVSAVFHYPGGVFRAGANARAAGRDPEGRSYLSFASFEDPDGNGWLLQEIKTRLPGREWTSTQARARDVATLARLLRETSEHHGHYENTHAEHHWWDWYASYLSERENGSTPLEAVAAATRYMTEVLHVLPK
jgi:catechol 2,3-dioxygenase-like lactoylglutathione lyase family enzyme